MRPYRSYQKLPQEVAFFEKMKVHSSDPVIAMAGRAKARMVCFMGPHTHQERGCLFHSDLARSRTESRIAGAVSVCRLASFALARGRFAHGSAGRRSERGM